ncbi:P-loop ATPase, Sll1717 family [Nonomuraea wenchangensis]|uniref:P-loop ATPase, Sll1717 family n=1 Tax=Nonomuraea wenchangensis TaxID=568860 RepID=UPI0033D5D7D8
MDITRLYFGRSAAEREVGSNPERFLQTYLDHWNLASEITDHEKFLILGPKGAGKSAAAYFVELSWKRRLGESSVFSTSVDFDELNRSQSPLAAIDKKLVAGEVSFLTDSAWKLFIGIRLLDSLISDPACSLGHDSQVLQLVTELRAAGLASDDYPQVLRRVRERRATFKIPIAAFDQGSKDSDTIGPVQLGDAIINLITQAETPNRHLLAIDGLDKAIGENDAYWRTLAALIRVGDSICRRLLLRNNRNVYLMIMCRSDVFRRANFTDAPKVAADSGIHMEWGAELQDSRQPLLWDYLAAKAQVDREQIFALLPDRISTGHHYSSDMPKYLLNFTRYTPRDMTELFRSIQRHANTHRRVTSDQVRAGADSFARNHLLHEIISESVGLVPEIVTRKLEQLINALPSVTFTKDDLVQAMTESDMTGRISVGDLGEYLFLQGAIGNYRLNQGYVQFYHRRNTAGFDSRGPWKLHTGLAYALNIPFS